MTRRVRLREASGVRAYSAAFLRVLFLLLHRDNQQPEKTAAEYARTPSAFATLTRVGNLPGKHGSVSLKASFNCTLIYFVPHSSHATCPRPPIRPMQAS